MDNLLTPPFRETVLQVMNDGVMILNNKGIVTGANPALAKVLGISGNELEGMPLMAVVPPVEENDEFMQALLDTIYKDCTISNRATPYYKEDGEKIYLSVSVSRLKGNDGQPCGAVLVLRDVTEIEKMRQDEKQLNQDLTKAMRDADESNKALQISLTQGKKVRFILIAAVFCFFCAVGAFFWFNPAFMEIPDTFKPAAASSAKTEYQSMVVTPRPFSRSISLAGVVAPLEELTLVAPFNGIITKTDFFYGERIPRNQTIITLDTSEIASKMRSAFTEYIKSRKKYYELTNWKNTSEVLKARRELEQARRTLNSSKAKTEEDKMLFEKGIIPRNQYDTSFQELKNNESRLVSSQETYRDVLNKGDHEYVEIARMELANAETNYNTLKEKMSRSTVTAPVSGVALRPNSKSGDAKEITSGMSVTEGQPLLSIASLEGLSISAKVDELNINSLQLGQPVTVTGDAFPDHKLKGEIAMISSQAGGEGKVPTFETTIRLPHLPKDVSKNVRIGMTANMQVETYSNENAIMVPFSAINRDGSKVFLRVREKDGTVREVDVETGYTTINEVEILSGIEPGTTILLKQEAF
ncbi:PAS domain S-box protein [Maridesulfovibrio salexigens]|uniref:Putative PAS/PAC sensor protein n=1 Tax=Maridesulfovibrio salexigens (strain ATCC 14822 / DSM 2638 / NCIMB 8403 / VKM B-1763) TaxID=526222 RepID=C6BT99_MARSD|nr:PAS domain S-box protein [Maridesulfovibrio salexigens]ACS81580.1 putative PAS/PAC sensor protein [Maridesulfovibrio salexigens DSM 2638]